MTKLTIEQIESIKFNPIGLGQFPYTLKWVGEIKNPATNVAGLICIDGNYYKPEYDMRVQPPVRKENNFGSYFSINKILGW